MGDKDEAKDTRIVCKYGSKCYQKNPTHHAKYKHPPRKGANTQKKVIVNKVKQSDIHKRKSDEDYVEEENQNNKKPKVSNDVSDSDSESPNLKLTDSDQEMANFKISNDLSDSESELEYKKIKDDLLNDAAISKLDLENNDKCEKASVSNHSNQKNNSSSDSGHASVSNSERMSNENNRGGELIKLPINLNVKQFIKEKFLCEMPTDFYQFWDFCKELKKENPCAAFSAIGLHLVGPYDVLSGKFNGLQDRPIDEYLIHWRYFYDPPEFQTVLCSDKPEGFHIGYFRDDMKQKPVFLASNCSKKDGTFDIIGDNIFAAVFLHLEEAKKTCDPFKKSHIASVLGKIRTKAESFNLSLSPRTDEVRKRKVGAITNNRLGLSVPYNKKSQVGYRELALNDKDLKKLLLKMKSADPEQFGKLLDELQPVLTYASIALDECDFGTGVKLGWEILFFGVEKLNNTIAQYLVNSYNLLDRPEFGQIAKAHMKNRTKSIKPSVL